MIPYGRQRISEEDIAAVVAVLKSDFLTQGPALIDFERALCTYTGAAHAVAVCNATSALHIACLALGLGAGDILWTSPNTFVASANCARYCGAEVDFVDIDERTYNMSVEALEEKLIAAKKSQRLPKVVVPVHLCGQPCDMAGIHRLAQQYGFKIIEDASHAIGAKFQNSPVGNSEYADITVFSFHPVKIITTGEGGMAVTNDEALAEKMRLLRSHGITRDPQQMTHKPDGEWYYQQIALGFNYRMTDIQAALGRSQLRNLDAFVRRRHQLADNYDHLLAELPLQLPYQSPQGYSALHLYPVLLAEDYRGITRSALFSKLREGGIGVNIHYIPVHLQPYYRELGFVEGDFPHAEDYYNRAITLPLYPDLSEDEQRTVVAELTRHLS